MSLGYWELMQDVMSASVIKETRQHLMNLIKRVGSQVL